ncbi:MAG TPA: hypothetical protein VK875_07730 [Euzebyales bacterium]|nr:hypothetical protein [Euzebyales bacterium]
MGNALSYTHQLWGLSRSLSGTERLSSFADKLGELEAVLEAELRRAEQIAGELERLGERRVAGSDALQLEATA